MAAQTERTPLPKAIRDRPSQARFVICGALTMVVVFGACLAIAAEWVPAPLQIPALFAAILAGLIGVAAALLPAARK